MTRPVAVLAVAMIAAFAIDAGAQPFPVPVPVLIPAPGPAPAASPVAPDEMPGQVLSGNPIGYLVDLFNAEYEVRASPHVTFGAGASRLAWQSDGFDRSRAYVNGDAFVRYYPAGEAFNGFALGAKAGYTRLPGDGGHVGVGIDINHSMMLNRHFYMGTGLGLKRLLRTGPSLLTVRYIPTFRFNVGVGF
ncbi:MAG: DUF3575 domain-containing protein [Vicinamibacterales bacterium]